MTKYLITALLTLCSFFTQAQTTDSLILRVQALFPEIKTQWIKHYKGRMDDLNDVSITLGFDGQFCRGYMTYLRSKESFLLDGTYRNDTLLLNEYDIAKQNTGLIKGVKKDRKVEAFWSNFNGTIGGIQLNLSEVLEPMLLPSFCGDNKWIRTYRGVFGDDKIELLLQKGSFGTVRGVGYFVKDKKSFNIKGSFNETKLSLDATLKDNENFKIGTMTLRLRSADEFVGNFILPDGKKRYGDITRVENINVGCTEYADYISSYDITYPKLNNESYNLWIQNLVDEWFRSNLAYINSIRFDNLDNVPEVRSIARAYAWCDVDYRSLDLISGYLVYGNSWTNRQRERVFIYDLEDNKELFFNDIFQLNKNAEIFVKNYIDNALKSNTLYTEQDFKDWAATQKFDNLSIRVEGINFASTSMAYGRQGITIPYSELLPYLVQRGSVWKLANLK